MSEASLNQPYSIRDAIRSGGLIAVGYAVIGSLLFAAIDVGTMYVRWLGDPTYGRPLNTYLPWFLGLAVVGCILTLVPALVGGTLLGLLIRARQVIRHRTTAVIVAGLLGAAFMIVLSGPYLLLIWSAHAQYTLFGNPAFPVYLQRLAIATTIGLAAGALTGWQLFEKGGHSSKRNVLRME